MKKRFNISFQKKIILSAIALILISNICLTSFTLKNTEKMMQATMKREGINLGKEISSKAEKAFIFEEVLNRQLEEKIIIVSNFINNLDFDGINNEALKELVNEFAVTEINVIRPNRTIIYSNIEEYDNWLYPKGHAMDGVFDGTEKTYMEKIRKNTEDGKFYKYGGIALDNGYYVQVGLSAEVIKNIKKKINLQTILEEVEVNEDIIYALRLDKNGKAIAGTEAMLGNEYTDDVTMNAVKKGEIGSAFYYDEKLGIEAYDVQIPYYENNELKGAISLGLSLKYLYDTLEEVIFNSVIISIGIMILASIIFILILKLVVKPLKNSIPVIESFSKGDFSDNISSKYLNSKDEIGETLRTVEKMKDELRNLISNIILNSENLNNSSITLAKVTEETQISIEETAKAVENLACSSNGQSNDIENIYNSSLELGDKINITLAVINEANELLSSTNNLSNKGKNIVNELNVATSEAIKKNEDIEIVVTEVDKASKEAASIINLIQNITNQTNLLALNASIEAARAGEAGKGFSVVANEMGELANNTKEAAEKIQDIINDIQSKTNNTVEEIKIVKAMSSNQNNVLEDSLEVFNTILLNLDGLVVKMNEVINNSNEVDNKKENIIKLLTSMREIIEENSATTEEVSATTEEQSAALLEVSNLADNSQKLAESLNKMIEKFKV